MVSVPARLVLVPDLPVHRARDPVLVPAHLVLLAHLVHPDLVPARAPSSVRVSSIAASSVGPGLVCS